MKTSVLMLVFNHERYIRQAVESVLAQETDWDYEIVIGDDCSTDRTRAILSELASKDPTRIRLLLHERNLGFSGNFLACLRECRGEYLAYLEGDDYWCSPQKLKLQVGLLERDPGAAGCFANALVVDAEGGLIHDDYHAYYGRAAIKDQIHTEDIVPFAISPSCTIVLRRSVLDDPPDWFVRHLWHSGLDVLITLHGSYRYVRETLGAYRFHARGMWSGARRSDRLLMDLLYLKPMYHDAAMRAGWGRAIGESIRAGLRGLLECSHEGEHALKILDCYRQFLSAYPRRPDMALWALRELARFSVLATARRLHGTASETGR